MGIKKAIQKGARKVVLSVAFCFLMAVGPSSSALASGYPVYDGFAHGLALEELGQKGIDWLEALALAGKTIKGITTVLDTFDAMLGALIDKKKAAMALRSAGQQAQGKVWVKVAQGISDGAAMDVDLEELSRIAAQNATPRHEYLCKSIMAHQLAVSAEQFEELVAVQGSTIVETMYRGSSDDGDGPQYAADEAKARKEAGLISTLDGGSSSTTSSATGTDKRKLAGSDLTASIFDGGQVLEIAKMESESRGGMTFSVPKPENNEQKFWLAGLYRCFELAGPRPTPPNKDAIKTPEGMAKRAQWNHCAAAQSALVRACTSQLALHTRPNSTNSKLRDDQKTRCQAASKAGIEIPEEMGNCEKGLSAHQAHFLAQSMCKSNQYYIAQSMGGYKHDRMMAAVDKCTASWNAWKAVEAERESASVVAADAMSDISSCWPK